MESVTMAELSKEVTTMDETPKVSLNIFKRMIAVQRDLKTVAKNLDVPTSKTKSYKAVSEVDIINAVKPLEEKHGIYSYPYSRNIIESKQVTQTSQYGDRTSFFLRVDTVYRFVNVDDPDDYIDMTTYGDGIDSGDKATGKAMTYADKYALMKAYKISTGEDPDQEPSEEYTEKANDSVGALIMEWAGLRTQLNELKIDYRSEKIMQWIYDHTGYADQDANPQDKDKMVKINSAYKILIAGKKKSAEPKNEAVKA